MRWPWRMSARAGVDCRRLFAESFCACRMIWRNGHATMSARSFRRRSLFMEAVHSRNVVTRLCLNTCGLDFRI